MSKWYIFEEDELSEARSVLLEDRDGVIYERFVINDNGDSWKCMSGLKFHFGYTTERLERYRKLHPESKVKEITEVEAFTILL